MFQKFFSDSLMSRFIKHFLSKESIPLLDHVTDGDIVIRDCLYIYKHFIIKCFDSGKLFISGEENNLFPSDTLYPSVTLFPGTGEATATYKVVAHFDGASVNKFCYTYNSCVHWYDSETHKHLGNYLRYLRDSKKLDLMPFYNCFNSYELTDVHLSDVKDGNYVLGQDAQYRVVAVPVKFNKTYTVALDCTESVQLRCVVYGASGMIRCHGTQEEYYSDYLTYSYVKKPYTRFSEPFLYSVETTSKELYDRQKDLYLLIQIPSSNNSSIVVLEGNYTNMNLLKTTHDSLRIYNLFKNLSLLRMNTKESYAFSDRLIEYLLDNVITHRDTFPKNIEEVQTSLSLVDPFYKSNIVTNKVSYGVWDDDIKRAVLRTLEQCSKEMYFQDHDGFINKDVERLLLDQGKAYRQ